jgi:hypothetical protein
MTNELLAPFAGKDPEIVKRLQELTAKAENSPEKSLFNNIDEISEDVNTAIKEIDARDVLYKSLDFISEGWRFDNATESRWRYHQ